VDENSMKSPQYWGVATKSIDLDRTSVEIYSSKFFRSEHDDHAYNEELEPYFREYERLSVFEFGEFEETGDHFALLLSGARTPSGAADNDFLDCVAGRREPATFLEQIIVKLVYQALAMGGLHHDGSDGGPEYSETACINDIAQMTSPNLRLFLRFVGQKAASLCEVQEDEDDEEDDQEQLEYEANQREIYNHIAEETDENRDDYEGWVYDD
jgi:uncharacterized protein YifE (UPF0438 family)